MPNFPNGKVSIKFRDTQEEDFTETPFYTNINFMTDNPLAGKNYQDCMDRFKQAIDDMSDLTTATKVSVSVDYSVPIV